MARITAVDRPLGARSTLCVCEGGEGQGREEESRARPDRRGSSQSILHAMEKWSDDSNDLPSSCLTRAGMQIPLDAPPPSTRPSRDWRASIALPQHPDNLRLERRRLSHATLRCDLAGASGSPSPMRGKLTLPLQNRHVPGADVLSQHDPKSTSTFA